MLAPYGSSHLVLAPYGRYIDGDFKAADDAMEDAAHAALLSCLLNGATCALKLEQWAEVKLPPSNHRCINHRLVCNCEATTCKQHP